MDDYTDTASTLMARSPDIVRLLLDADIALADLGACNDPRCEVPQCLHLRQRIDEVLRLHGVR